MDIHSITKYKRHRRRYNIAYISAEINANDDIDTEIRGIDETIESTPAQK